jgi:hypothetical protein
MTEKLAHRDSESIAPIIALWGPIIVNPPHVSLTIGGQFPQGSLGDYLLVSRDQLKTAFRAAQIQATEQSSNCVTVSNLISVPTTSTILIDTWYGSALMGDLATYAQELSQTAPQKMKRVPAKDEGLYFDPDDFVER